MKMSETLALLRPATAHQRSVPGTQERHMATYVLPDNRLTPEQRDRYWFELCPEDAVEFMAWVLEQFPAVYDDAVLNTGRPTRLRAARLAETTKGTTR